MQPPTPLSQTITSWVHKAFASLRKTVRSNLALFLPALLFASLEPTLSDLARRIPLPTQAQSRLNRLWRFLHHPTLQHPWTLTAHLLPLLLSRFPKTQPLPLLVDWTPAEDGAHQALAAALPLQGRILWVAFELHPLTPWPSQNRVEEEFLYRLGRRVQDLGYTPLFILDRGFDRFSLMKRLQEWGMGFLIRLRRHREVRTKAGESFLLGERYPEGVRPRREVVGLSGHNGCAVEVELFVAQGKQEPWYLALWSPLDWEPSGYRLGSRSGDRPMAGTWRMWIEEGFRDLKGGGFGLHRHRLRTEASLRGWLWLLALGMALLVLLGAVLRGREWLVGVLAYPERQSLFRLARIALAQGPPLWQAQVVAELGRMLWELGGKK